MISKSIEQTSQIARDLAARIMEEAKDVAQDTGPGSGSATVIALRGDLGSGKTTFTKALAAAFDIDPETVTSPTFVIQKSFPIELAGPLDNFIHIDAYRLEKPKEIEKLGWRETIANPANLVVIEWPENIGAALPKNATAVMFKSIDEGSREITILG